MLRNRRLKPQYLNNGACHWRVLHSPVLFTNLLSNVEYHKPGRELSAKTLAATDDRQCHPTFSSEASRFLIGSGAMSYTEDQLAIRITNAPNPVAAIKPIRAASGLSIGVIRAAISAHSPLTIARLYGVNHEEIEQAVISLFDGLEKASVEFEIILGGNVESREYFVNAMQRWRYIVVEVDMMSDLESGEPCIETLEWLRSSGDAVVFQQTIRQIINAEGYNVDAETLNWAKRQIDAT